MNLNFFHDDYFILFIRVFDWFMNVFLREKNIKLWFLLYLFLNSVIEILQTYRSQFYICDSNPPNYRYVKTILIDLINIKKSESTNWIDVISIILQTIFECFVN